MSVKECSGNLPLRFLRPPSVRTINLDGLMPVAVDLFA